MERGIDLGFFTLRYYSLLFAGGFVLGYMLMKRIFKKEGIPQEKLDTLLTYVVIATILGARLGHVFFYQWDYYSQHPGEILKVWEGGLASHGAAIAIIIAIVIYSKRELKKSSLWMLDRLVITIALAAALIRLGNWFNSEIYGDIANSELETVYTNPTRERLTSAFPFIAGVDFEEVDQSVVTDSIIYPVYAMQLLLQDDMPREQAEQVIKERMAPYVNNFDRGNKNIIFPEDFEVQWDMQRQNLARLEVWGVPRHPTQLYEALGYFLIFLVLYRLYLNRSLAEKQGFLLGMFLILLFGFRFFIEYFKEVQVSSEYGRNINIGQYLSIPLVLAGLVLVFMAKPKKYE